jgi:hypothetical protein
MTPRTLCALLAFACASSGCFRSTTTIELRRDGSGTIVQETTMKTRTLAAMEELLPSDRSGKPQAGFIEFSR